MSGHQDADIVFLNMARPTLKTPSEDQLVGRGVTTIWQTDHRGVVDPRPFTAKSHRESFDKIHNHGGIFVFFIDSNASGEYGEGARGPRGVNVRNRRRRTMWEALTDLGRIEYTNLISDASEIVVTDESVVELLTAALPDAWYTVTLSGYAGEGSWHTLATNKYGEPVAAAITYEDRRGPVFLLPQLPKFHLVAEHFLADVCSRLSPQLFQHLESQRWTDTASLQPPEVQEMDRRIQLLQESLNKQIEGLRLEKAKLQETYAHELMIITATGEPLVLAVAEALRQLGFAKLVDVDAEEREKGNSNSLREDLRIEDSFLEKRVVVDIKGISGIPRDSDIHQSQKHAHMRIVESGDPSIRALTIVNHERRLPPDLRTQAPFRAEMEGNAKILDQGLLSTITLRRILRDARLLKWPAEVRREFVSRHGAIDHIPCHYEQVGEVCQYWKKVPAFSLIPSHPISVGDRLAIDTGERFFEIEVSSIRTNDSESTTASPDTEAGICADGLPSCRPGMPVYRVH
ncbi:MAG: hypothetical protein JJ863_24545 [Deltaproteobacteria bacterium]|nr:hypothetical protein [Deltaproteobacteria bacterium]